MIGMEFKFRANTVGRGMRLEGITHPIVHEAGAQVLLVDMPREALVIFIRHQQPQGEIMQEFFQGRLPD